MSKVDFIADEILKQYGAITRARNCFLYTKKGVRLTDMYQEHGRAILGWGGKNTFTMMKNVLERGIVGSFHTEIESQLQKAVSKLLKSERRIFVFNNRGIAEERAYMCGIKDIEVWRPWCWHETDFSKAEFVWVEPPLAWTDDIFIIAVKNDKTYIPDSYKLPAPLSAAVTRSIYNIIAEEPKRQEKDFFIYDTILTKYWTRKGPYLFSKVPSEKYEAFVKHCLNCHLVISPSHDTTSIIPYGADKGVFNLLKNNPFEF